MNDRFVLEGITYFQQGRTCGHTECKCHQGELHGPYWYSRDNDNGGGAVKYIGKELPQNIIRAREAKKRLGEDVHMIIEELQDRQLALLRLLNNSKLSDQDRLIIEDSGFGEALVKSE